MRPDAGEAITALSDAFRRRSLHEALDCFAADPAVMYSGSEAGEVAVGEAALRNLLAELFSRDEAYSWTPQRTWASPVGDRLVVLSELTGHAHRGAAVEDFPYRISGVLCLEGEEWRWVACHTSEPTPPGGPGDAGPA